MRVSRLKLSRSASGFTLLECVIAILVINLTVAGLLKLMSGQDKQVAEIRKELASEKQLFLRPHEDPLARKLGMPARVSTTGESRPDRIDNSEVEVVLLRLERELNPAVLRATFYRQTTSEGELQ